jgi:hypothetical protein
MSMQFSRRAVAMAGSLTWRRRALWLALLLGSGVSPALTAAESPRAGVAALTAEQIVDRHVAARGGLPAWRALQTIAVNGKLDAGPGDLATRGARVARGGKASSKMRSASLAQDASKDAAAGKQVQLPFVLEMKRPHKSRIEIEFAGKTALQVFDGSAGWLVRPYLNRDSVEPFTAEQAQAQAAERDMDGPLIDYAAKGTKVELEAVEAVEGRDAYKLKLTTRDGREQRVWIDRQSFLDVKVEGLPRRMDGKLRTVWVYQRDFRPVQGLMLPFVLETAVDGYRETHKLVIEKAAVNPKLDDALFGKPKV